MQANRGHKAVCDHVTAGGAQVLAVLPAGWQTALHECTRCRMTLQQDSRPQDRSPGQPALSAEPLGAIIYSFDSCDSPIMVTTTLARQLQRLHAKDGSRSFLVTKPSQPDEQQHEASRKR